MFLLDSLMIGGIRWALNTTIAAAEAEMNDDSALREQLLEAEMRREMGEISDGEFAEMEADLLGRIREIKARREGGSDPMALSSAMPIETEDRAFTVEASVSGDFHDASEAPHTRVIETSPASGQDITVIDVAATSGRRAARPARRPPSTSSRARGSRKGPRPTDRR